MAKDRPDLTGGLLQSTFGGEYVPPSGGDATMVPPGSFEVLQNLRPRGRERRYLETVDGVAKLYAGISGGGPGRGIARITTPGGRRVFIEVVGDKIYAVDNETGPQVDHVGGKDVWVEVPIPGASDGGPVLSWDDQSGSVNDFGRWSVDHEPTYWGASGPNGQPVVRFGGTPGAWDAQDALWLPYSDDLDFDALSAFTVMMVVVPQKLPTGSDLQTLIGSQDRDGNNPGWRLALNASGQLVFVMRQDSANLSKKLQLTSTGTLSAGTAYCLSLVKSASKAYSPIAGDFSLYINSDATADTPTTDADGLDATTRSGERIYLGSWQAATEWYQGDFAAIVIARRALSDADRQTIQNAWATKFGLTLT